MQSLKDSELRYRRLFEAAQDGILLLDANTGLVEDVNPYLTKLLGYSHEEFIKKKLWEVGAFKDIEASQDAFKALQKNEYIRYDDLPLKAKDGKLIQVEFVSNVYQVANKNVIQCNIRDIAARRRVENTRLKSEENYHNTLENLMEGCQIIGYDWRYLFINNSAAHQAKLKKEELLGHTMMECYPGIEKTDMFAVLRRCMDERKSQTIVNEFKYPDDSKGWFEMRIQPSPNGLCILSNDITERKQADEVLQKNEKRFRALVKYSLEGIFLVNSDGTIIYETSTSLQPPGYPPNSFIGINILDLCHPEDRATAAQLLEQAVKKSGSVQEVLFRLRHQDGAWHWMEGSMINLLDEPAVQSVVINYRDVTARQQSEQEIINLAKFPSENPNPVLRLSRDGIVMYANSASDALLGMWGCAVGDTVPQFWCDLAAQGLASGKNTIVEIKCQRKIYSIFVTPVIEWGYVNLYARDITDRKQSEEALRTSLQIIEGVINSIPARVFWKDKDLVYLGCNTIFASDAGFTDSKDIIGKDDYQMRWPDQAESYRGDDRQVIESNSSKLHIEEQQTTPDGNTKTLLTSKVPLRSSSGEVIGVIGTSMDITERKQTEEAVRLSEEKYRTLVDEVNDGIFVTDKAGVFTFVNSALVRMYGVEGSQKLIGRKYSDFDFMPVRPDDGYSIAMKTGTPPEVIISQIVRPDGSLAFIEIKPTVIVKDGQIVGTRGVVRDITERKEAAEEIKNSKDELSMLFRLSHSLAGADNLEDILDLINHHAVEGIHTTFARIALLEDKTYIMRAAYPIRFLNHNLGIGDRNPVTFFPDSQHMLEHNEPIILRATDLGISSEKKKALLLDVAQTLCVIPLRIRDSSLGPEKLIGLLMLGEVRNESREPFTPNKIRLAQTIGDSAAVAIRRMLLREQTERHLHQLVALSEIDLAIISSSDMVFSLGILLSQTIEQLKVDAAAVWQFNPTSQMLKFITGRGFRTQVFEKVKSLHVGEGYAGQAARERRTIHVSNLTEDNENKRLASALAEEPFVSYYAVPLVVKEQIIGVLELFHRTELESNEEWRKFLHALANQAAFAIDNSTLFNDLQDSNADLFQAYDATIQGWSRALDLRDNETEGHTQRVTELTMELGALFGLSEEELVHVHRGALLHDIGKMGVPDRILLKPGPLTDEEWEMMKKHPTFAYELLSPIHYLRLALDIPYCHHEKWDGTGYPRGLIGEQIPLVARIFAVVDVWDALTSDRPYRKAWSNERTIEYIKSGSGTHFDPQVVKTFLLNMGTAQLSNNQHFNINKITKA